MDITPDNWNRIKELFEAALGLEPSHRAAFLAENCDTKSLRQQIEMPLVNYEEAGSFLDEPILNASNAVQNWRGENLTGRFVSPTEESRKLDTAASAEDPMLGRQLGAY